MQRHLLRLMLLLFVLCSSTVFAQSPAMNPAKGVLRVKLQPEVAAQIGIAPKMKTPNGLVTTGVTPFDRASSKVKAVQMKRVFPYVEKFEAQRKEFGLDRWYEITFDEGFNPLEARQIYSTVPGVQVAENISPMSLIEGKDGFVSVSPAQKAAMNKPSMRAAVDMPFNDPRLRDQWHYHNDGSMAGSVKGADINLFEAWKLATGSNDVLVAIIDGGVDYTHVDLADNMWINEAELNGVKGKDDDGNGYIDDIYGYNFVTNSSEVYPHTHGTHVAGTVAAVNNNGIGVSGVAGGNGQGGIKMISCQVFDSRSGTGDGDFASALVYAAEMGASIAQCSWGWSGSGYYEQAVLDAIDYFTAKGGGNKLQGGLCIFASGNEGATGDIYPGCYEKVLCVGAMTYDKTAASYTNYGEWVDVTAPGGLMDYNSAQGVLSTLPNDDYGYSEGTSMATPHVSGIAALVLSKYGKADLPNETLRQQLVTSVNDIYDVNPNYAGKLGSGYIDAWKAMQMSDGQAPDPVADFTLLPAQDNVVLEWIIPMSSDNNVNHHTIYYSKTVFTASDDLTKLMSETIDTKFLQSGDKMTYELGKLESRTTYYIAMKSVDRWGNAAPLSAIKTFTTNAGPKMELDKTSLAITVDATTSSVSSGKFVISNKDEGLLKWSSSTRTVSMIPSSVVKPNPGSLKAFNGDLSVVPFAKTPVVSADYRVENFPVEINYSDNRTWAYIGESNLNLPNSQAQWFKIEKDSFPEGFNLTHLNIGGAYGKNPIIQIYEGSGSITKGKLLQTLTADFSYMTDLALNEQLYFAPGESFWVVLHFAKGQTNPLGLGVAQTENYKTYSYMSFDLGETWTVLSESLVGSPYEELGGKAVWNIAAKSKNPDWSTVMTLNPASGTVKSGEHQDVVLSNDGQKLVNGTYKFNLKLTTNETEKSEQVIAVNFKVQGYKPELKTAKVVDFGNLLVGQTKKLSVEVINNGFGGFYGDYGTALSSANIKSTSDQFITPTYLEGGFSARAKKTMEITYTPTMAGSHTSNIILTDKNKNTYQFTVHGVATEPAEISISPAKIDVGELEVGAAPIEKIFKIANTGKYPLEYVFPKFSNEKIGEITKTAHKFGYTYISNLKGATDFEYDHNPALVNATEITNQFTDENSWSKAIPLGFSFPYYGKMYDRIYVTSYGGVAMEPQKFCFNPSATADCVGGMGLISAYGNFQLMMGANSKVEWAKQDGKFVVKFADVLAAVYDQDYIPISFHITIASNGDVEIFYDNYTPAEVFDGGRSIFVGLNDIEVTDPFTITDANIADNPYSSDEPTEEGQLFNAIGTGTAIKFQAPDKYFIQKLSSPNGIINPGDEVTVTATMAATEDMYAGDVVNKLVVLSNDPKHSTSYVTFNAIAKGDCLKPKAVLESGEIDFGKVFRTSVKQLPVTIKNIGNDVLEVTSVKLTGDKFQMLSVEVPFTIKAGNSKDVMLTLPTENEGRVNDVITIETSVGQLTANLSAEVIGVPVIALNIEEITETMASGATLNKMLEIKNEGNEPLSYSITPNEFIALPPASAGEDANVDYLYSTSVDNKDMTKEWVDIETTGLGEQNNLTYYLQHSYVAVDLPFEFPFYGKMYKKMYIYNSGFVSFTEKPDDKSWPEPPANFPTTETLYTNMIAPYWGLHSMDQTRTAGTFHYITEDRAVVSFMEYGNTMNLGVCYQVILNKDGSFKFQYKAAFEGAVIFNMFGVAGIANDGGTEGINLPARTVKFGEAVEFYPVTTEEVANGATKTIELKVLANKMAGEYTSGLVLNTNVPGKEKVDLPIKLTITGTPDPVFPKLLGGEWVNGTGAGPMGAIEIPFQVANNGTAMFTLTNVEISNPNNFTLFNYGEHVDDWFGDVTYGWGMYIPGTPLMVGSSPTQFKVFVMDNYTVADYDETITFTVEGLEGKETITVPLKVSITPAPVMAFDKEEIRVSNVTDDYTGETEMTITNKGEYKLTYNIALDPTGEGEASEDNGGEGGGVDPMNYKAIKPLSATVEEALRKNIAQVDNKAWTKMLTSAKEKSSHIFDVPEGMEYSNALYYPVFPNNNTAYQYGTGNTYSVYKAATYFVAPEQGFNLSHVYLAATVGTLENVDIKVEVIKGEDLSTGAVLGQGNIHIEKQEDPSMGQYLVIALDKPVYLHPGEKFHMVATYPKGITYPAYLCAKEEAYISNRYMGWTESYGWFDAASLFKDQYGSLGYIMTCIEQKVGESWISLLTTETSGELNVGQSKTIKVKMNAATAPMDKDNKAVLVIKSNDPEKQIYNYPVYLDKNVAPVVTVPSATPYVKEGITSKLNVEVIDQEGEAFTVTVADESGVAKLDGFTVLDGDESSVTKDDQTLHVKAGSRVRAIIAVTPDYGMAGTRHFTVLAKDKSENASTVAVNYYVEHVNRAPIVKVQKDMEVKIGTTSPALYLSELFEDPDGDALTYKVTVAKNDVVDVYNAGESVIFSGKKIGEVSVKVTATDASSASTDNTFKVKVVYETGIGEVELKETITVYPNPVVDKADVVCNADTEGEITYKLYDTNGALLYNESATRARGEVQVIDMTGFASGIYYLELNVDGTKVTVPVMKK